MTISTTTSTANQPRILSRRGRAGHVLGIVLGSIHVAALAIPTGGDDAGPPLPALVVGAAIGLAVIALLLRSWRHGGRAARRTAAALLVLAALGVLPGLLVADVALALRITAGAVVGLTAATLLLLFLPASGANRAARP